MRTVLGGKVHRATVTDANMDYEGSVTIDPELMEAADILPYELVHILDIDNGSRLQTYAIEGQRGSREVCINGAAARLIHQGDKVIILAYQLVSEEEARAGNHPRVVLVDSENNIVSRKPAAVGS